MSVNLGNVARNETRPRLADPGALLATTHRVGGGTPVRLRLTRPSDAPRVEAFLSHLSPETRRRRFFVPVPDVGDHVVRHFTFYDPRERLVVAATVPQAGGEELVGLADVVLLETGLAELAVVVGDEHQALGVGTLLAEAIASLSAQQGATHVKAEVLGENQAMTRVMERLGTTVRSVEDGVSVVYTRLPAQARRAA